jgi:hypothetical protein
MNDLPRHRPIAPEAPIPGRQWYGGCNPDGGYVTAEGVCDDCGERACPVCGSGYYGPRERGCQCSEDQIVENAAAYAVALAARNHHPPEVAAAFAAVNHGAEAGAVLAKMREEVV